MQTSADGYPFALLIHIALVFAGLLIYAVGTHASGQHRHPSAALAWVLAITLLPYLGLPLFVILGTRKFARPTRRPPPEPRSHADDVQGCAIATLAGMGLPAPQSSQKLDFQTHGQLAWEALESLINSAQTQLDLCTYVLGNDSLGKRVAGLLEERAAAGVRVRLLLDAVGSWRTSSGQLRDLRAAGIEVHWSMPVLFNLLRGRGNLRNHRKLVIADSQRFWSGGRNLAAEYFSGQAHQRPWTDLSFSIDGPLAQQAQALFNRHWRYSLGLTATGDDKEKQSPAVQPSAPADSTRQHYAQLVPSGPDQAEDTVYGLLLTTIFRAEQRVLAVTPYFVPDDSLLTALCLAARRGVRVELVLPARSNHRLADIARARALRDLVAAGAHVRLATGMVHAKALVVDQALALCGSVNLDSRSLFLNFELMVAFYSNQDIAIVAQWMDENFNQASDFHPVQPSLLRDIAEGLVRWLGFQI